MATKTSSRKVSVKSGINLPKINLNKNDKKKVKKDLKNVSARTIGFIFIALFIGFVLGSFAYLITCRNDCFSLCGEEELTFILGERYVDEGVKVIEFSRDIKDTVYIETNLQQDNNEFYATEIGSYYIKYLTNSIKYGKIFNVTKVRIITFVEESEGGE